MRVALIILLLTAIFVSCSIAISDSYSTAKYDKYAKGLCTQTIATSAGDINKYSNMDSEKSYPYEKCTKQGCSEYGKEYYANGICPSDGEKCRMFEYCPKCGITYEIKDGKKADGVCDFCGSPCYMSEKCDKCGFTHYFDGYCDKCGEPCSYNKCAENCYLKCMIYEYDLSTGEKQYCDGNCNKCGDKCNTYAYCPNCNKKYPADGSIMNCPDEGTPLIYVEQCDKCGYTHYYDGYSDTTHQKCVLDKCCYVYCDKYCYEYTNKPTEALCPSCAKINIDTDHGKSTEKCDNCAKSKSDEQYSKAIAY